MKAISLTQPWAILVAIGAKRIETRSWSTSYRGPIAIHAAKGLGPVGGMRGLKEQCGIEPFCSVLTAAIKSHAKEHWSGPGFLSKLTEHDFMPFGAIVATANLVKCLSTNGDFFRFEAANLEIQHGRVTSGEVVALNYEKPQSGTSEFAFGDYSDGRYMWFLEDVKALSIPIECKGALGIWKLPDEIARRVLNPT